MRGGRLGTQRAPRGSDLVNATRPGIALLLACLLLALAACGNKGPLYLPDEEVAKKTETPAE